MTIPKIPLAQTVIQLCKAKEIKHIVISPGSRNAPLTIGFTNDSFFTCYSIVDERCAAFFALGIAQQIQHPVAVVCTSGSALLNYYPAVAEAFYSNIPLLVLSADRPKYLVGIGDGQTINQKDVYSNHILCSVNLRQDVNEENDDLIKKEEESPIFQKMENTLEQLLGMQKTIKEENESDINIALNSAISNNGPVHINCPFDEPLYETVEEYSVKVDTIDAVENTHSISVNELSEMNSIWNNAGRKLILAGVNAPNKIPDAILDELAKDQSIVVFTETTSNIHHDRFFPSIDKIIAPLNEEEVKNLQPDLLVTFGGMIVSKKIKAFLRQHQPKHHWHIDRKKANDTFFCLDKHIKQSPKDFFPALLGTSVIDSDYQNHWKAVKERRNEKHEDFLNQISFSDFSVFNNVLKSIPDNTNLHLGNSSTIRYTQLFDLKTTLKVFCNRGTSGIDGSTSTAIGAASVSAEQSIFITGDLSFFYDSNALWNNYIPNNFRIIIINNGGGGIFRILPGHKNTQNFDQFFETTHNLDASQLCNMYGFKYQFASNKDNLESCLESFYSQSEQPKLLEIFTPRTENDDILLSYFKFVK